MSSASDDFNRANGGLGGNWTATSGVFTTATLAITSNQVASGSAAVAASFWNALTFGPNQFSQVAVVSGSSVGVTVMNKTDGSDNYYFLDFTGGLFQINKVIAGSGNTLVTVAGSVSANDVLRLEISAGVLKAYQNGLVILSVGDSTFTSGAPGILSYATTGIIDNWSGGDLSTGNAHQLRIKRQ